MTKSIIVVLKKCASVSLEHDLLFYSFFHFIKKTKNLDQTLYFRFGPSFPFLLDPIPTSHALEYIEDYNLIQNNKNYRVLISDEYTKVKVPQEIKSTLYHSLKLKTPAYVEWKPDSCLFYIMLNPDSDSGEIKKKIEDLGISHTNKYIWTNKKENFEISDLYPILTFNDMWEISKNCETLVFINQINTFQNELIDMNNYSKVVEIH